MPACDVLFAMTGDVFRNARALRQIRALDGAGIDVRVLALEGSGSPGELPARVQVDRIPVPAGRGIRFFRSIHREFGRRMDEIRAGIRHASDLYVLKACHRRAVHTGSALTYDARELYAHVASTVGRPWVRWTWTAIERACIQDADHVFTVSASIADHLERKRELVRADIGLAVLVNRGDQRERRRVIRTGLIPVVAHRTLDESLVKRVRMPTKDVQ